VSGVPFKPNEIEAVLFDLDGTLMDSDDLMVAVWERRFKRLRRPPGEATSLARRLVMALERPTSLAFGLLDLVGLDGFLARLVGRLQGQPDGHFPPVAGAADLINQLAGRYRLAVVSTRTLSEVAAFLASIGVGERIGLIVGRESTWRIKPHPQPINFAARGLGVPVGRCLMVGDTPVDMRAARRAGAWACGVLCGYGERAELERAGAHVILEHTRQLAGLLADG
jgi:phosphoglycolate phosphatase-like HAD superfamily hydrolase